MLNLLWLILIIPANRLIGLGMLPRAISLPLASLIIGACLTIATGHGWYWLPIFGVLFAAGRGATVADGLNLVDKQKIDRNRDSWDSLWITRIAFSISDNVIIEDTVWALIRIIVFYLPLFLTVNLRFGLFGAMAYGVAWAACYGLVKPIWSALKIPVKLNCYTAAAEWAECFIFALILGILI